MSEYIKRSYLEKMAMTEPKYTMDTEHDRNILFDIIRDAPSANVAPIVYGKWRSRGIAAVCSVCGADLVIEQGTAELNYCPNCGARMDGGNDYGKSIDG